MTLIERLTQLHEQATPGPWRHQYVGGPGTLRQIARQFTGSTIAGIAPRQRIQTDHVGGVFPSADGDAIAALRNALPALIAYCKAAHVIAESGPTIRVADLADLNAAEAALLAALNGGENA